MALKGVQLSLSSQLLTLKPTTFYDSQKDATVPGLLPIVAKHPGGRIACVTHGGVLDCVYRYAHGLALDAPRSYALLNTSINTVEFGDDGAATVLDWADVSHLSGASDDDGLAKGRA